MVFLTVFGGIWLSALFVDRKEIRWRRFIAMSIFPVSAFIAWLGFSWAGADAVAFPVNYSLVQIRKNLEFQVRTVNGYFVPLGFWLIFLIVIRVLKRQPVILPSDKEKKVFIRAGIILLCNLIVFTFVGLRTMRYYVQYLPFLFMMEGFLIHRIFQWKKALAVLIIFLAIFTNFLSRLDKPRAYFLDYLYELSHRYTGPMEALCNYLDLRAKPGERIKIIKGDLEVMFYHPELVILNDKRYFVKSYPEWIVIRGYWNPILELRWKEKFGVQPQQGYLDVLDRYEKIPLPAVDSIREDEPDNLETHFFRGPEVTPENQMFVYRLKGKP